MATNKKQRKLVAILFADIVGYTALMQTDEAAARRSVEKFRNTLNEKVAQYNGQVVQYYGDGCLCTFDSAVNAMECARTVQQIFQTDPQIPVRIGVHSGDVFFEAENVFGDSVNIASRIESLGTAGAVLFSKQIKKHISNQKEFETQSLGAFDFKNVEEPMEVFALANAGLVIPKREEMKGKLKLPAKRNWRKFIPAILGVILLMVASFYWLNQHPPPSPADISSITIFPFDIKSGNPNIQYLGQGMVDLISTKLEGVPNLNPIDPNRVFNQLEKENEEVPALEKANKISNTLGAAEFILGSVIEINEVLQISASKYNSKGGLVAKQTIEGQKTQLASLIDDLTRALIADKLEKEGQELNSIAMMTSENLPALKAYLEGEQAFRKVDFQGALRFFQKAVSLDSTFAMAWFRLYESKGWISNQLGDDFLDKAIQYADKLPPKWQDLINTWRIWETGLESNEKQIADLLRRYGENAEFTNLMAEHLFHFNPIHGRSKIEAKPWLEKSRELDPQNQETLRHLADIAWMENDAETIQKIMGEADPESHLWVKNQLRSLVLQDRVTEAQLEEVVAHPKFRILYTWPSEAIPEDPVPLVKLGLRLAPLADDVRGGAITYISAVLKGQEKEATALLQAAWKTNPPNDVRSLARLASIIAGRSYLPYEELYQLFLDSLRDYDTPRAIFASAKYAWTLGQEERYQANKQKLAKASEQNKGIINPARYYHWSLTAFEAQQHGDSEKALVYIDSAFQYNPAPMFFEASESAMDKIFMLADIYEEQQAYEKAIQRLENLPNWRNYHESIGYATYRLTQLYEKNGDIDKALAKCNLFLKNYQDCDEKYRPWWEEVAERQKRLMAQVN